MATSDKTKTPPPASAKQSTKARRAAQQQQRQKQQQLLFTILAVGLLGIVVIFVLVSVLPKSVNVQVPDTALTRYKDFADPKLHGVTTDGFPYLGAENAPSTIQEIGSFSCPVCFVYHRDVFANILDEIKAGRAKFVFIPVTTTGEYSPKEFVTQAAYCALQQDKFWEFHDILYAWQQDYISNSISASDSAPLKKAAQALNLDMNKFNACLDSADAKAFVKKGNDWWDQHKLTGTPTVFLNDTLLQPLPQGSTAQTPSLSELRGLIEAKAATQ